MRKSLKLHTFPKAMPGYGFGTSAEGTKAIAVTMATQNCRNLIKNIQWIEVGQNHA